MEIKITRTRKGADILNLYEKQCYDNIRHLRT